MTAEREVLVSALKLTSEGSTEIGEIRRETRVPTQVIREVLTKNCDLGIVQVKGKSVVLSGEQRLRAAVRAITLGADIQRVCNFLTWAEFEDMSVLAFESDDFKVKKHFRFNWSGRRWEIDILGLKEPIVASVDCKHWRRGWRGSASRKAAEQQIKRTAVLAEASTSLLERINIEGWKHAYFVPAILSLVPSANKFHKGAPIVPVLQLGDFLQKMPAYLDRITHFHMVFSDL